MSDGNNHDQSVTCPHCGEPVRVSDELARRMYSDYLDRQLRELAREGEASLARLREELEREHPELMAADAIEEPPLKPRTPDEFPRKARRRR